MGIALLLFRKKIVRFIHIIGIPLILSALVVIYFHWGFYGIKFWSILIVFMMIGIVIINYLSRPGVKEIFK